jgi:hypothetical protein
MQVMKDALNDLRWWGLQRERTEEAVGGRRRAFEGVERGKERLQEQLGGAGGCCRCRGPRVHADRRARRRRLRRGEQQRAGGW